MEKHKKKLWNNNKFQTSTATWNDEFEFPDGSCSILDSQDCFAHILKKHREKIYNPPIKIYVNKSSLKLKQDIVLRF